MYIVVSYDLAKLSKAATINNFRSLLILYAATAKGLTVKIDKGANRT